MTAYYNEFDPKAAAWLRELIAQGHIAQGDVDERSITDVSPADLAGYAQCHFFAGIGGWSLALRQAGWPDDHPVWTGSCPCQPFSAAGKRGGTADERHLWPAFFHLIDQCRPPVVFGEQVASKDGLGWFDLVSADLEGSGYSVGAADLCAAGIGAPHIRQRLWFVGMDNTGGFGRFGRGSGVESGRAALAAAERSSDVGGLAHSDGRDPSAEREQPGGQQRQQPQDGGTGGLADTECRLSERRSGEASGAEGRSRCVEEPGHHGLVDDGVNSRPCPVNSVWRDADWLFCRDGKWRPVEPGTFPLAHGIPGRVGLLRGYGNAIVPAAAQAFIEASLEALDDIERVRLTTLSRMTTDNHEGVFG